MSVAAVHGAAAHVHVEDAGLCQRPSSPKQLLGCKKWCASPPLTAAGRCGGGSG